MGCARASCGQVGVWGYDYSGAAQFIVVRHVYFGVLATAGRTAQTGSCHKPAFCHKPTWHCIIWPPHHCLPLVSKRTVCTSKPVIALLSAPPAVPLTGCAPVSCDRSQLQRSNRPRGLLKTTQTSELAPAAGRSSRIHTKNRMARFLLKLSELLAGGAVRVV